MDKETNDNDKSLTSGSDSIPLLIQDEMKSSFMDYAMSVIISRALPDVRDGLKPVHRRILYAMFMLNNYHNKPFVKSARIVGEVIGKYHPHGDSSVYGTIVRMAQDFAMRHVLVDGQGNFGSIDGDNAAAMRYTEARMKKMAEELLKDIDKETVDWRPNYDESLKEPIVLPSKIPNLLINGSTGIAVGMSTNIPPHNLKEVMGGLLELIDNPDTSIDKLTKIIPGPDFPTAGTIHGGAGIKSAYHTGKGIIQVRAKCEIETVGKTGKEKIVVSELPYQVIKARLIEKVAQMVTHKELNGISDIRDESNKLGIRIVIDLKRGEIGNVILNRLYKNTQLQTSYGIIFLSIHNNRPKVMNLKELLECFIDHRREVIVRRTQFELKKAKEKAHILEGLKLAVENMDSLIELIKKAESPAVAKKQLMSVHPLSDIQAQAILDMRLQRLTGLEREKIVKDYENIMMEIARLEEILGSDALVNKIIREEFVEIKEKYGDDRRTEIVGMVDEIQMEDLIKDEDVIVIITQKGYIKRMAIDTYKSQKRGGMGVRGIDLGDDFYTNIFVASTLSNIMFFTNKGTVFVLKVYNLPEASRTRKGRNIINLLSLPRGEEIKEVIPIPKITESNFLIIATERGMIKKTPLSDYKHTRQNGLKAIKLQHRDTIIGVRVVDGDKNVVIFSSSGKVIRFDHSSLRSMGRVAQGVKGICLEDKERAIGMEIIDDKVEILSITEKGYGKRSLPSEYRKQSRGGKGILAMKLSSRTGDLARIMPVCDKDDLMVVTNGGQVIRIKIADISLQRRATQGVKIIKIKDSEKVVAVEKIIEESDDVV